MVSILQELVLRGYDTFSTHETPQTNTSMTTLVQGAVTTLVQDTFTHAAMVYRLLGSNNQGTCYPLDSHPVSHVHPTSTCAIFN